MSDAAAILATFATWRPVQGRKVLQLIFEVPLEDQGKVLTHLGAPMPGEQKWCGIALVTRKGKAGETGAAPVVSGSSMAASDETPPAGNSKPKRRWQDMPASQRAALWIKDPEVWAFLNRTVPPGIEPVRNERDADAELKRLLSIASKADLDDPAPNFDSARTKLQVLQSQLLAERQARGHGVI